MPVWKYCIINLNKTAHLALDSLTSAGLELNFNSLSAECQRLPYEKRTAVRSMGARRRKLRQSTENLAK